LTSDKKIVSHNVKRAISYTLSLFLTVLFLYIAFHNANLEEVFFYVKEASIFWVIMFLLVGLVSHFLRALRWKYILHSVKPDVSVKNLFGALMVGYGVNCVVPRLGEVSRAVLVGKWEGLSRSALFGTVILERVIDMLFLGVAVLISIFFWREELYSNFPWLESSLYITMGVILGLILFLYLVIRFKEHFYGFIIKIFSRISEKLAHKLASIFEMLAQGFGSLKGVRNYIMVLSLSASIIILYAFNAYIGFFTIGMQEIQPVNFQMGWVLMSISAIGIIIPTPGGTGSYHTLAKSTLVLFGFTEAVSLAYAFLTHIVSYILFIFSALIIYFVLNKQHESLIKVVETNLDEL
jgi:glycosyltransferase 2 family protein